MKRLFGFLMIVGAFTIMTGCPSDDTPGGGGNCDDKAQEAADALTTFIGDPNASTCQAALNAVNAAINACSGVLPQDDIDDWNDFLATDPCDGL
jgi:hypothetical protein